MCNNSPPSGGGVRGRGFIYYEKFYLEAGAGTGRDHHHRDSDYSVNNGLRGLVVLLVWMLNVSFV